MVLDEISQMEKRVQTNKIEKIAINYDIKNMKKLARQYRFGKLKDYQKTFNKNIGLAITLFL